MIEYHASTPSKTSWSNGSAARSAATSAVGTVRPGASTLGAGDVRLLLYRAYISAVLVTEVALRDYQGEWVQHYRDTAAANLDVLLDQLSR